MSGATFETGDLRQMTDVQLVHRINRAMADRETDMAACGPSRASRLLRWSRIRLWPWYAFVAIGVQTRDALHGGLLAVAMASQDRLSAWAERSQERMRGILADIAILRMLDEMERRVGARGMQRNEPYPELRRG